MADIIEVCEDSLPCQGMKLAMEAGTIQKIDSKEEILIADGFIAPEERFFFALKGKPEQFSPALIIDTVMPIECCPFCSDPSFVANV